MNRDHWIDWANHQEILNYHFKLKQIFGRIQLADIMIDEDAAFVYLRKLYVEPYLQPDRSSTASKVPPFDQDKCSLITALKKIPHLVVLGDPGTGKSTLLHWIATNLATSSPNLFKTELGPMVPLLVVLRDISLAGVSSLEELVLRGLASSRLKIKEVAKPNAKTTSTKKPKTIDRPALSEEVIRELLASGQGLLLIDGLDEVSDEEHRERISLLLAAETTLRPQLRMAVTSRIVGYDRHPVFSFASLVDWKEETVKTRIVHDTATRLLHFLQSPDAKQAWQGETLFKNLELLLPPIKLENEAMYWSYEDLANKGIPTTVALQPNQGEKKLEAMDQRGAIHRYLRIIPVIVSSLDERQIRTYTHKWYTLREGNRETAIEQADSFCDVLFANSALKEIAGIPLLLAFLAFIQRRDHVLPHDRTRIYLEIAKIFALRRPRRVRGDWPDYSWHDLVRWIGRIALQMELDRDHGNDSLIRSREELEEMVHAAMVQDNPTSQEVASVFLRFVLERAGLILEKGPNEYGFVHLSIQEFFAGYALSEIATKRAFNPPDKFVVNDNILRIRRVQELTTANLHELAWHWCCNPVHFETLIHALNLLEEDSADVWLRTLLERASLVDEWDFYNPLPELSLLAQFLGRVGRNKDSRVSRRLREQVARLQQQALQVRRIVFDAAGYDLYGSFDELVGPTGFLRQSKSIDLPKCEAPGVFNALAGHPAEYLLLTCDPQVRTTAQPLRMTNLQILWIMGYEVPPDFLALVPKTLHHIGLQVSCPQAALDLSHLERVGSLTLWGLDSDTTIALPQRCEDLQKLEGLSRRVYLISKGKCQISRATLIGQWASPDDPLSVSGLKTLTLEMPFEAELLTVGTWGYIPFIQLDDLRPFDLPVPLPLRCGHLTLDTISPEVLKVLSEAPHVQVVQVPCIEALDYSRFNGEAGHPALSFINVYVRPDFLPPSVDWRPYVKPPP